MDLSHKLARVTLPRPPPVASIAGVVASRIAALAPAVSELGAAEVAAVAEASAVSEVAVAEVSRTGDPQGVLALSGVVSSRPAAEDRLARVRALLAGLEERPSLPRGLRAEGLAVLREVRASHEALPGERRDTPDGRLHVVTTRLEPDHHHGRIPIVRARDQQPELIAELALDAGLAEVDLTSALFLDTETTGLAGGTGTIPFLIGMAAFTGETFEVEQLLLLAPGEERPMLERLRARMATASCLITFNGKSFDLPLLITRLVLHRITPPPALPHLDLLHSARRVYKRRLSEVRLVRLEEEVLGMRRERDVNGQEIPGIYWNFVRTGSCGAMARVLEHNAHDLIALAALLARLGERFARVHAEDEPDDHLSMAKVAMSARDPARASAFALAAADGGGSRPTTVDALLLAARLEAAADVPAAIALLERALLAATGEPALAAAVHLRLAKLHEHKTKDLARARRHASWTATVEGEGPHRRRVERLERRAAKAGQFPTFTVDSVSE